MSLDLVDDDLTGLASAIWTSIMGLDTEPEAVPAGTGVAGPAMTACVHITGGWQGSVAVVLPTELAGELAAAMFDVPAAELTTEEVLDAVGELANIAGGNVKGAIEEACDLSLPVVAEGDSYVLALPGSRLRTSVTLAHQGRRFCLQVHERA